VAQHTYPSLQGQVFYQPSLEGFEGVIVARRREAQMEALVDGVGVAPAVLTTGPTGRAYDRWLQRTLNGEQLAAARSHIYISPTTASSSGADLNAGRFYYKGALRRVPEGGVYACTHTPSDTRFTRASSGQN